MQLNLNSDPTANDAAPLAAEPAPKRPRPRLSLLVADAKHLSRLHAIGVRAIRSMDAAGKSPVIQKTLRQASYLPAETEVANGP